VRRCQNHQNRNGTVSIPVKAMVRGCETIHFAILVLRKSVWLVRCSPWNSCLNRRSTSSLHLETKSPSERIYDEPRHGDLCDTQRVHDVPVQEYVLLSEVHRLQERQVEPAHPHSQTQSQESDCLIRKATVTPHLLSRLQKSGRGMCRCGHNYQVDEFIWVRTHTSVGTAWWPKCEACGTKVNLVDGTL